MPEDEIRGATRRAFDNLIALAIDEKVNFVLLAGDLYDGDWKDYNTGLYFVQRMGRLRDAGIRVFIVAGNHDAASQITKHLRPPDNVRTFSTQAPERIVLDDLDVVIHGQGFATRAVSADLAQGYPQAQPGLFNIGLLHTCLDGKPGHEPYAPCTVDGLRSKGYQYWALGHVHRREVVGREDPWIVFPGNLQGRHVGESGAKGCTVVRVDDAEVSEVRHHDLDVMRWAHCKVTIDDLQGIDGLYARVADQLSTELEAAVGRPVAVRLTVQGCNPIHSRLHAEVADWTQEFRALASGLGGAGLWLERFVLDTRQPASSAELLERDDVLGGLLRAIDGGRLDESTVAALCGEVDGLRRKLPATMLGGEDGYSPGDPEQLKATLEDVRELLVTRLLRGDQV